MIDRKRVLKLLPAALLGSAAELAGVALIASAAWLIARAGQHPPLSALAFAVIAVRACGLARAGLRYADRLLGHDTALRALADLRARVFDHMRGGGPPPRDADAVERLVSDVDTVQDLLLRCLLPMIVSGVAGLTALGTTLWLNRPAGLVLAAGLAVAGIALPVLAAYSSRSAAGTTTAMRSELAVRSLDVIRGADDLAVFGATERALGLAVRAAGRLADAERRLGVVGAAVGAAGVAVQGLTALGVTWVMLRSGASTVMVTVLALTTLVSVEAVLPVADAARRFTELRPAMARITGMLGRDLVARPGGGRPPGTIELFKVRVAYGDTVALDGVDLRVPAGRRLAIVGASGAGKSTLLAVLSGEITPDSGLVLAGGRAAADGDLRAGVRGVAQDAHIFATTIRANLALGRPAAPTGDLRAAARRAGLLDWIDSLPAGLETPVDPRRLSGGQRARLLLARALLADPPVLALDEPTEGLDVDTADALVGDLLTTGRTLVMITHRLAPLGAADEIVVLDEGKVAQRGTHAVLIARPGPYRDLWETERLTARPRRLGLRGRCL